ncbi:PAS modulated sigma54 specific transcriptional regulator, Fis family [Pseudodesulfovibrio piezophilus C1TLV30]|uniref:PAS modulated sigma54 specific transcriptional regulator, Fis family n=1 Tax=Pseudodesulfovibrio piezophilus (strain DSM 21447 / JCM 15486 / C1TLV30) TaxID=1322246 RepID=M1WV63_PSEP2|nr:PAS modulated sigma54 specific transcriptional regulator, Fis family [Pseudodesulfovibrio piezophilus C1TLV30]
MGAGYREASDVWMFSGDFQVNSTVLVALSDAAICRLICDILTNKGFEVIVATSGQEAVDIIKRQEPDVLLVDHEPGGESERLLAYVKSRGENLPVILVTGVDVEAPEEIASRMGALSFVRCPVDRCQLEEAVRQGGMVRDLLLREKRTQRSLTLSRSFLGAFLDTGDEAAFLLDSRYALLEVNRAGAHLLNGRIEDLVLQKYLSRLSSLSRSIQEDALEKAKATGQPQQREEYSGGAVFITQVRPVYTEAVLAGFVVVTRDITAQRQSEVGLAESEKRYRSVYEAARDAIIMVDRNDGAILDCNAAGRQLYGYPVEVMLDLTIRDLSAEPERTMESIRSGAEHIPLQYHCRAGGVTFPVEVSMSHFVHDGREVCTVFIQDISQRKVAEEALREGARLYRAVVEDQTELICRYNPDGELTFINGAYAKFFGVDEDEIVGQKYFPTLAGSERRDLKSWIHEAGPDRPVFDREQYVERSDGEPRWVLWTNRAVLDQRGDIIEVQAVGRDVTDRKEAENALDRATAEKEQYRLNLEATFRSIPDAIVTVDSELRVIATNSAAGGLLSLDREIAQGRDFRELIGDSGHPCLGVLKQVLRTSKSVRGYEADLDVPTLGQRMVELNCTPLVDQNKQHIGAVLVVRDVSRIADLEKRLHERHGFRGIIGRSSMMQDIYKLLEQLSSLDSIVLILGESGTGKELIAEALHYGGSRAGAPLVKVNCSALSENLLESELFGHVRGAFTGAVRDKVGRIQAAQGGTLFLDEIGDISPLIQLKLLRFLEQKEYERVGESKTHTADVRIIAATNVNLLRAVKMGTFREDLYYRLNVMPIFLPPLRERQADIPLLVEHFLEIFSGQFNKTFEKVSDAVLDLFMGYSWPGNVRELRHILEHACILSPGSEIGINHMRKDLTDQMRNGFYPYGEGADVPLSSPSGMQLTVGRGSATSQPPSARKVGKQDILEALTRCGGNKAKAARQLGIHRATLYRKLDAWDFEA